MRKTSGGGDVTIEPLTSRGKIDSLEGKVCRSNYIFTGIDLRFSAVEENSSES